MTVAPTPLHRRAPRRSQPLVAALLILGLGAVCVLLLFHFGAFKASSTSKAGDGSGVAAAQPRALPPFHGVELAGGNDVVIRVGGTQSVVVHADDNLLTRVTTRVHDGTLVIGTTPGTLSARSPMHVDVTTPSLSSLALTGSGVVSASGIAAPTFTIALGGSGVVRADGTTDRLDVTLAGSGDAQLQQLVAGDVRAIVSGSGRILVTATQALDASVPGSGAIVYGGDPAHVTTSVSGSGAVVRG